MLEYKRIKITSQNEIIELTSFLNDIIKVDEKFKSYNFGIVRFYGITKDSSNDEVANNIKLFSDFSLLLKFINNMEQIFEIEILIDKTLENIKRYSDEVDSYSNNEICIEYFDGGFWEITSKDHSLITFINEKYFQSEII
ncbi:hypothetical protein [Chryseobacterium joostei]|uniref:hypothetical protein n=1 Tax=Chryseobacterium joostei TaxID=112234 RepID=UPI0023F4F558|nr:hypothetical protein [Chryseobacterium joostei]